LDIRPPKAKSKREQEGGRVVDWTTKKKKKTERRNEDKTRRGPRGRRPFLANPCGEPKRRKEYLEACKGRKN